MPTNTPNVGLQVPDFNQANWQTPTNFNWSLLDQIFGGTVTIPALSVLNLIVTNIATSISNSLIAEQPSGVVPGSTYIVSNTLGAMLGFFINGLLQRPGVDYTVSGNNINLTNPTTSGDSVFSVYLKLT
jgi:hypothetical protein